MHRYGETVSHMGESMMSEWRAYYEKKKALLETETQGLWMIKSKLEQENQRLRKALEIICNGEYLEDVVIAQEALNEKKK